MSEQEIAVETPQEGPEEWKKKEEGYLQQISNLRKLNEKLIGFSEEKAKAFESELAKVTHEKDLIKRKLDKMEFDELKEAAAGTNKNLEAFKQKYDKVLKNAQDLLFERQKSLKSMELKIEAQNIQIESLKDVVSLTKDMLTIRECEVRDLTERMEAMGAKFQAEKDRKALMERKMELSDKLNLDLKSEYKAQKEIFEILKGQYKLKVSALEEKLKGSAPSTSNGTNGTDHQPPK